ncbi:hypothetical protein DIPPA_01017 [Diplonema papillatum]|nr:hypothetical protein DIPPA_01017 [Diplonema papillatum]
MFRKTAQASGYQGYKGSYNKGGWSSTGYQASWSGDGGSKGGSRGMSTAAKGETSEKGEKGDRGGEKVSYVVHAAGPQRHGMMVHDVCDTVARHGGDVLSSRATRLGSDFSMMLVVKCDYERADNLKKDLAGLEDMQLCFHPATAPDVTYTVPHSHTIKVLRVTGHDTKGVVSSLASYMAINGVRIINFASEMAAAPFTDDPMFKLRMVLDLPPGVSEESLEDAVEAAARVLGVDLWVEAVN